MVATLPSGERPEDRASTERIILVEHDATHAHLIQSALSASYEVEWLTTGAQALRRLRGGRCLAVITEHELPDMSGFELRRKIMGSELAAPVIMTCAEDEPPEIQAGLQGSGCDFFVKGPILLMIPTHFSSFKRTFFSMARSNSALAMGVRSWMDIFLRIADILFLGPGPT